MRRVVGILGLSLLMGCATPTEPVVTIAPPAAIQSAMFQVLQEYRGAVKAASALAKSGKLEQNDLNTLRTLLSTAKDAVDKSTYLVADESPTAQINMLLARAAVGKVYTFLRNISTMESI